MKKKNLLFGLLSAATMVSMLYGCGSTDTVDDAKESTTGKTSSTQEQVEESNDEHEAVSLRFSWWGGDDRNEATLKVIENFEKEYPWITIEPEFGGSDGYQEKLSTSIAGGTAVDIIQNGTGWMPAFVDKGDFFIDFNEYTEQIDLSKFDKEYLENVATFDGKLLGLPTGIAGPALLINKDLADAAVIEFKDDLTWDDLIEMGKQVKAYDSNLYLINIDSSTLKTHVLRPYILQLTGKPFITDEEKAMSFTKEELTQTLDYIKALYDNNVVQPANESASFKDSIQTNPKWIAGEFVCAFTDSSRIDSMTAANEEVTYSVGTMPHLADQKDDGFYANPPQLMCIYNKSEHIEEALLFLDYFYNDEGAAEILKDLRSVPATSTARGICEEKGLISELVKESVDKALEQKGTNEMGLTTDAEVEAVMDSMIESVIYGQSTTAEAAESGIMILENVLVEKR